MTKTTDQNSEDERKDAPRPGNVAVLRPRPRMGGTRPPSGGAPDNGMPPDDDDPGPRAA